MPLAEHPRVVVTGAGSGLGRAICLEVGRRGGKVLAADVKLEAAEETVAMLGEASSGSRAARCDVSKAEDVAALAEGSDEALGGVDLVVNNAGVAVSGNIGDVPLANWEWIIGVNLWGVVHGCHYFVPRLKKQGHGAVLNVASAAGFLPAPMGGPYCATKAAVISLSEALHAELAKTKISVTVLCPSFFRTNLLEGARGGTEAGRANITKAMDRASAQADDVARLALRAVERSQLFALPHANGKWAWLFKRLFPGRYTALMAGLTRKGKFDAA